ncbi:golgin-45 [Fopius arisanus]|uniref:Blzf1 protein n=1 Tax=Fopius arisanus TaxID=64838 RepID=A0A0C9RKB4_9HYME|nr:PREDICTED: golgin-45 [Fopius arisanus]
MESPRCEMKSSDPPAGTFSASRKSSVTSTTSQSTVQSMAVPGRTQGDGMENTPPKLETKKTLRDTLIYHPTNLKQSSCLPPVTPTGTIVNLTPRNVIHRKEKLLHTLKCKEPKFVPYEPYKAAVNPIIPVQKKKKGTRNNLDINEMVAQVSIHKSIEMEKNETKYERPQTEEEVELKEWQLEKKAYELELKNLRDENTQLENQLKFQAQVNGELKNLLVAAVGEDLETRVHLLTEDKLQLARALLNSAQHLSTHQEQTEWLAGQCEVWRSKFLASSLMVEELARWKAGLSQRTTDLQESIKRLLEERSRVRETSLRTYKTLCLLRENFDPVGTMSFKRHELPSSNVIDLADGCCQVAEILKVQLLSGVEEYRLRKEVGITGLEMTTAGEKKAEELLMNPNLMMARPDVACSAVMGAAVAVGGQMFRAKGSEAMACCPHCSGEVKQV